LAKESVFIAAWSSPIIALVALIRRKSDSTNPLNWSDVVLYVGSLSALAAVVTSGIDPSARMIMNTLLFMSFGAIIVRAGQK
jgi:hypothetical protein